MMVDRIDEIRAEPRKKAQLPTNQQLFAFLAFLLFRCVCCCCHSNVSNVQCSREHPPTSHFEKPASVYLFCDVAHSARIIRTTAKHIMAEQ